VKNGVYKCNGNEMENSEFGLHKSSGFRSALITILLYSSLNIIRTWGDSGLLKF